MVRQVIQNLIENAVKYSGKRAQARIEIGAVDQPAEHGFYVRDNGVGFSMEHADQLFGIFKRLHSEAEFEGIGIGLANVRRIMQKHGGRVWFEAERDKGATFFVAFPKVARTAALSGDA
jgi:light-regulated signal transduction histidine kinase (bacteriophytochrome)